MWAWFYVQTFLRELPTFSLLVRYILVLDLPVVASLLVRRSLRHTLPHLNDPVEP